MRHRDVTRRFKEPFPDFCLVGTGYGYLQECLPNVAQAVARLGSTDLVGLGRMVLACPEMPLDILRGADIQKERLCRTFSDCATAPRKGLASGCHPLDPHHTRSEPAKMLATREKREKTA